MASSDGVKADAERRSTGGFSPGLAVSEVYDGDWVDDRRCGKGTVTYSNGEVEVASRAAPMLWAVRGRVSARGCVGTATAAKRGG